MNEGQPMNDHKLPIGPCVCGHEAPEVSGDDFDADVSCPKCDLSTPTCFGTRGAIAYWNREVFEGGKLHIEYVERHRQRHVELHGKLDELVADFFSKTGKFPSTSTVLELIQWSHSQTFKPS